MNIKNRSVQMNNSKRCEFIFHYNRFLAVCRLSLEACRRITVLHVNRKGCIYSSRCSIHFKQNKDCIK